MSHPFFRSLSSTELETEIVQSRELLEKLSGQTVQCLSIPYGTHWMQPKVRWEPHVVVTRRSFWCMRKATAFHQLLTFLSYWPGERRARRASVQAPDHACNTMCERLVMVAAQPERKRVVILTHDGPEHR